MFTDLELETLRCYITTSGLREDLDAPALTEASEVVQLAYTLLGQESGDGLILPGCYVHGDPVASCRRLLDRAAVYTSKVLAELE